MAHKAGFVSIIGKPNVGKSTLMNRILGQHLSIVSAKAQTTRHRIKGILNAEDYQIVFSDTPGLLDPHYLLHQKMMDFVDAALEDADAVLFITDTGKAYQIKGAIEYHDSGIFFDFMKEWNPKQHPGHAAAVIIPREVYSGAKALK